MDGVRYAYLLRCAYGYFLAREIEKTESPASVGLFCYICISVTDQVHICEITIVQYGEIIHTDADGGNPGRKGSVL